MSSVFVAEIARPLADHLPVLSDSPTWKSLISDTLAAHERVSLLTMIFSDKDQVKLINDLSGGEAQTFVDKIDEVTPDTRLINFV